MKHNYLQKVITIDSRKTGPSVVLLAGIHGNEPAGILAFRELKKLKIIRGKIQLIYGNIRAIQRKKRFIDSDLNRLFRLKNKLIQKQINSYEYQRSREIMPLLDRADILLDIHSTSKKTLPFVICGLNAVNIVSCFPFNIRCYGFDKTYPGSTSYYMNTKKGKIGIGIECGQHNDKLAAHRAITCVKILLSRLKMIRGKKYKIKKQKIYKALEIYITKTDKFKLEKNFKNFENINNGQLIATDGNDKIISRKNQFILFAKDRHKKGEEGFLYLE